MANNVYNDIFWGDGIPPETSSLAGACKERHRGCRWVGGSGARYHVAAWMKQAFLPGVPSRTSDFLVDASVMDKP